MRLHQILGCLVVVAIAAFAAPASGQVVAETDCWQTQPGTFASIPALAPGFLGAGCAAVPPMQVPVVGVPLTAPELVTCDCPAAPQTNVQWVDIHGDPVPAGSRHAVSQVPYQAITTDTCVRRNATATFPGGVGVPEVVPIELVQLSLVSVAPIVVNCPAPTQWNVVITENGVQLPGTMELTPTVLGPLPSGTVTVPNLPVNFQFRFERIPPGPVVSLAGTVNMQNPNPQAPGPPGNFAAMFGAPVIPMLPGIGFLGLVAALLVVAVLWTQRRRAPSDS